MQKLLRILVCLSLILLLASSSMAIRSYFRGDWLAKTSHGRSNSISSAKGSIVFDASEMDPLFSLDGATFGTTNRVYYSTWEPPRTFAERLGFWSMDTRMKSGPFFRTIIPYWPLIALFGVLPADAAFTMLRGWLKRRWPKEGLCRTCGYDLRESKQRCPECGTEVVRGANPTEVC
jgi:hypothetical protein